MQRFESELICDALSARAATSGAPRACSASKLHLTPRSALPDQPRRPPLYRHTPRRRQVKRAPRTGPRASPPPAGHITRCEAHHEKINHRAVLAAAVACACFLTQTSTSVRSAAGRRRDDDRTATTTQPAPRRRRPLRGRPRPRVAEADELFQKQDFAAAAKAYPPSRSASRQRARVVPSRTVAARDGELRARGRSFPEGRRTWLPARRRDVPRVALAGARGRKG